MEFDYRTILAVVCQIRPGVTKDYEIFSAFDCLLNRDLNEYCKKALYAHGYPVTEQLVERLNREVREEYNCTAIADGIPIKEARRTTVSSYRNYQRKKPVLATR